MKNKFFKIAGILIAAIALTLNVHNATTGYGIKGNKNLNPEILADGSSGSTSGSTSDVWNGCGLCATEWTNTDDGCTETSRCECINGSGTSCIRGIMFQNYCEDIFSDTTAQFGCGHG